MLVTNSNLPPLLQMYINALLKRGGIFVGHFETEKCKTFFEKALAIDANCTDVFIHRARVSIVDQINFISSPSFFASLFYLSFSLSLPCSLLSSTSLSLLRLPHPPFSSPLTPPPALPFPSSPPLPLSRSFSPRLA